MKRSDYKKEWRLLQNQFDSYEKFSLIIKLVNIGVFYIAYVTSNIGLITVILITILWLQDAIWKTFQSRIDMRLHQLEGYLLDSETSDFSGKAAYQFNSLALNNKESTSALIEEYIHQAIRPTIAYPHILLLLLTISYLIF